MHVARKRCAYGCNLKKGHGHPKGTTRLKGYGVGTSCGRPVGTTVEKGYGVSTSGGRPVGTTAEKGYGQGRPVGTTQEKGFSTGGGDLWVPQQKRGMVQVGGGYQTTKWANTLNSEELIYQTNGTHLRIKLAQHCGHDLKFCVLIVICTLSHSTLSACSSRLLVGFSMW